jgi:hypothetical protein
VMSDAFAVARREKRDGCVGGLAKGESTCGDGRSATSRGSIITSRHTIERQLLTPNICSMQISTSDFRPPYLPATRVVPTDIF